MRAHQIKAVRGYKKPRHIAGRPSILLPNRLQRESPCSNLTKAWVTYITYIRTWQGWLYLAVVLDLYARKVVGWSMKPTLAKELVLDALLMALVRLVAESFFSSLKKERIRKRIYKTRDLARADIFDYIEAFYNRTRRHSHLGGVNPEAFERAAAGGTRLSTLSGKVQGATFLVHIRQSTTLRSYQGHSTESSPRL
jgi:putative transposase